MTDDHPHTPDPLAIAPADVGEGSPCRTRTVADAGELTEAFAVSMLAEYNSAKAAGRTNVVFIVPAGPFGQFERLADRANAERVSLRDLVVINMDEYLTADGQEFIVETDPLSFRGHMQRNLWGRLDPALAPPIEHRHCPNPGDPAATARLIERCGVVDVTYGGVGITGHLAFNDPPEPHEADDEALFADLPTRVVMLNRETRTINAVTAACGNIERIPRRAITVGMREILASRKVRNFLPRPWQCAIVRKVLHGPITSRCPASLLQRHPETLVAMIREVTERPEPTLR